MTIIASQRPRSFIGRSNFKDEPNYIGQIASVFIIDGHAVTETEARALMVRPMLPFFFETTFRMGCVAGVVSSPLPLSILEPA